MAQENTSNDAKYKAEFKAGTYQMTEAEYVSMRRIDDGIDKLQPGTAETTSTSNSWLGSGL